MRRPAVSDLAPIAVSIDDRRVFWRRPEEPLLDRDEVNAIFRYLMQIDAKLDEILECYSTRTMAEQKRWTPEDEAAVEASIRNVGREMRERLYMREAAARERRERAEQRRRALRRFSFGLLGRE